MTEDQTPPLPLPPELVHEIILHLSEDLFLARQKDNHEEQRAVLATLARIALVNRTCLELAREALYGDIHASYVDESDVRAEDPVLTVGQLDATLEGAAHLRSLTRFVYISLSGFVPAEDPDGNIVVAGSVRESCERLLANLSSLRSLGFDSSGSGAHFFDWSLLQLAGRCRRLTSFQLIINESGMYFLEDVFVYDLQDLLRILANLEHLVLNVNCRFNPIEWASMMDSTRPPS